MTEHTIGQELEAYCGKCKIDTLHLITAASDNKIDKVMCKVCTSYHKYKKPTGEETEPKSAKKTEPKPAKKPRTRAKKTAQLLKDADIDTAIEYKMGSIYEVNSAISHKKFGLGIVKSIIDEQKMEVLFNEGEKILVQNIQR